MYSIDEVEAMLSDIADELPDDFWTQLNGGVILLPEVKYHPAGMSNDLYILGDYNNRYDYGRCIRIYYGSFIQVHGHFPPDLFRAQLRSTLLHEFTHHLESLAGERGLEIKDKIQLEQYKRRHHENL